MPRPTRYCRVAWLVEDYDASVAAIRDVLGMTMRPVTNVVPAELMRVGMDEHGLEPIQLVDKSVAFFDDLPLPLIEIALAVDDAPKTRARLAEAGIEPSVVSPLPGPDTHEFLYGGDKIHGIPLMICTDGDNEQMLAPFRDLESAPVPKSGAITIAVDNIDAVAADLGRFLDMQFTETDPGGLGARAVTGPHRIRLIEGADPSLSQETMANMMSIDIMFADVEERRLHIENLGFPVLRTRVFSSGRKAYYFGSQPTGFPLAIYSSLDDKEMRGIAEK